MELESRGEGEDGGQDVPFQPQVHGWTLFLALPCYHIRNPFLRASLTRCKSIALHTAASAASNPVGSNGKLEKDRPHSICNYININEASVQGEMLGQELAAKA